MEETAIVERVVTLVNNIGPSEVHPTICSFYDIHNQLTPEIMSMIAEELKLQNPPIEMPESMTTQQYITACLLFIMFWFNQESQELKNFMPLMIEFLNTHEITRHYDRIYAKIFFFYAITADDPIETLLAGYRRACDIHFHQAQATIVNCILKYYIDCGGYNLAISFLKHCNFPREYASPAQLGRFHFFQGHLKAVTLDYAEAQHDLQLALRRAPQNRHSESFRSLVSRHLMVVMMLQGQVPSRDMLLDLPIYLDLARSILQGDVMAFQEVAQNQQFVDDGLAPLVQRLRSAVILAGLTMIAHCYSRITFSDIAEMLHIGSAEDAEGFCAKAAADGLIDAVIDHKAGCLESMKNKDDVAGSFSERIHKNIKDCFGIREDTQKTMHEESVQD